MSADEASAGLAGRRSDGLRLFLVVLLGGLLTLLAAVSLHQTEVLRLKEHRNAATDRVAQAFQQALTRSLEALRSAALMLEVHPQLSRAQFNDYMGKLVKDQLSINLVEWQPIVPAQELRAFEAAARREDFADFEVVEPDSGGAGWRPAAGRDPYVVVRYAWPEQYRTIGYDLSFSPERMASKLASAAQGVPVASAPFEFMKEGKVRSGSMAIAISMAVFTPERQPRGYLAAVVDLPTLFQPASQRAREAGLDLLVVPEGAVDAAPIYTTRQPEPGALQRLPAELSAPLDLAGQRWRLALQPGPDFDAGLQPRLWLWTLLAGALMTALLARAVMLLQQGRRRTEQAEAAAKQANHSLRIQTERLLAAQRIAHLGNWQADLRAGTISWSEEIAAVLGLAADAGPQAFASLPARFSDDGWARLEAALRGAAGDAFELELACERPDGERRWLQVRGAASPDAGAVQGVAMDISARKSAELEISSLAFSDALTGLPNRRLLIDRLVHALAFADRSQRHGALLFVDLDGFKKVNDSLGHQAGDRLLQLVAQRLRGAVRQGDTVARLGGDEFVLLLEDIGSGPAEAAAHAELVGKKLLDVLAEPYPLGDSQYEGSASIGLTLFGSERLQPEELLRRADVAMYRAKSGGQHLLSFYDPSMQAAILARAQRERELREALQADGLRLHYQPQVDEQGRIVGVEALLRLQLPGQGLVGPQAHILLAEETGLIVPLGRWVLRTAVEQLAAWALLPERAALSIAVNVSARQFRAPDFVPGLQALLAGARFAPEKLKLELTESVLLDEVDTAIATMQRVAALGLRFSLDDFGTGYSSLSYLKRLPLQQLKIDKSFVDDLGEAPDGAAIAQMIVALGDSLGLEVIAEGVERPAQREALLHLGCRRFQGYLFGRPMAVAAFEALLDSARADAA